MLHGFEAFGVASGVVSWALCWFSTAIDMGRVFQWIRIALAGLAFVGFGVGGVLLACLVLPVVARWPGSLFQSRQRCQRVVRAAWIFFHDYMRIMGLVAFNHRTCEVEVPRPSVIIANHPTLVDITALVAVLGSTCFVVKQSLFRSRILGPLLRACGHICNRNQGPQPELGVMPEALSRLAAGHSVLLFPEGTRSQVNGLRRFRLGAFELARQAGVPLVVLGIRAEPPGLGRGTPWHAIPPVAIQLRIFPVAMVSDWRHYPTLRSLSALRTATRDLILERVHGLKPGAGAADDSVGLVVNREQS